MILREIDRTKLIVLAEKHLKTPCSIWAYGSRVNGQAHDCSDLDIVVKSYDGQYIPIDELSDFISNIKESTIPIIVQVFDWARLPDYFHKNILQNYEVLFETKK